MKLSRASIALYMGLVFVSGTVLGVFGDRYYDSVQNDQRRGNKGKGKGDRMSPEEFRRRYMEFMETRLSLSAGQVKSLTQILDETQGAMDDLMRRTVPEQQALRQRQTDRIRGILNDEQKGQYEVLLKEREERERNKRNKSDGRKGGPGNR